MGRASEKLRKTCWHCDRPLGFAKRLTGALFCSKEHEELYNFGQSAIALHRVLDFVNTETSTETVPPQPASRTFASPLPIPTGAEPGKNKVKDDPS